MINNHEVFFDYDGQRVRHVQRNDMSKRKQKLGKWIEEYYVGEQKMEFEYPIRGYENKEDLLSFLKGAKLELVDVVHDYNNKKISDPGWVEYVLEKK